MGNENRLLEIKNLIENEFNDWMILKVLNIELINGRYKIDLIDSEMYKYCSYLEIIRNSRRRNLKLGRYFHNNIYTIENIKNWLRINNKEIKLISNKISNAKEKVIWNCFLHGNFEMSWNCIYGGTSCPICGDIKCANSKRNDIEYVRSKFKEKDLELISEEYINNEEKLNFICPIHKNEGIQQISFGNLITGGGCNYCSKERRIENSRKTHEQFEKEFKMIHGTKYTLLNKYINSSNYIELYCNNCDMKFYSIPHHLLEGHGCPNCNISKGEELIKQLLLNNNIKFIQQFTFKDCRNKRKLPFDFAIFDSSNNLYCLIEYQGIQHYKPIDHFGGDVQFQKQIHIDNLKRNYCKDNNIKLLEIPYYNFKSIKDILIEELII